MERVYFFKRIHLLVRNPHLLDTSEMILVKPVTNTYVDPSNPSPPQNSKFRYSTTFKKYECYGLEG